MTDDDFLHPSRRSVLGSGALILSFALLPGKLWAQGEDEDTQDVESDDEAEADLPGSLGDDPYLDSWIRVDADNTLTVFTGKIELGQGIKTAILQVAAEELFVTPAEIVLVTADTGRTPDEGFTAGSQSMQDSATAIRHAAAQVRSIIAELAAERLGAPVQELVLEGRTVAAPDGSSLTYGELIADRLRQVQAAPQSPLKNPADYTVIGQSLPRVDIPAKVTGGVAYVQDLRLPGMLHARMVRPRSHSAEIIAVDTSETEALPGVVQVVRDGNFLAVVAEGEWQAVQAMRVLARSVRWEEPAFLPEREEDIFETLRALDSEERLIHDEGDIGTGEGLIEAEYFRDYQMHASIGPSCAVALWENDLMTVWTHSQGVYPLREGIAEMLDLPLEQVRCIHLEGSGCYGHNGADDAAGDAAMLAMSLPGQPVRVQWMREDEHIWEPYGAAMQVRMRAGLDDGGGITEWRHEVWSNTHSTRPGGAGALSASWLKSDPILMEPPEPIPQPAGGGDRNAIPLYTFASSSRIVDHFITQMPLRVSALRALGAYTNVFALECFLDELALEAGVDPIDFRLRHMEDERARDVISLAAEAFGWGGTKEPGHGHGFGFARYKNLAAYFAVAVEVAMPPNGTVPRFLRAVAAIDSGEAVNPDGMRNQAEGGIIQSASWTLLERVRFDPAGVNSRDWSSYPILRMKAVPETVDVHIIDRPGMPYLGTGEAAQGPVAAAIGNAIADATGLRFRHLPITADRMRARTEGRT